jgi:hypothetical protein
VRGKVTQPLGDVCCQPVSVLRLEGIALAWFAVHPSSRFMPKSKVYIPVPTWSNHHNIWRDAGRAAQLAVPTARCWAAHHTPTAASMALHTHRSKWKGTCTKSSWW